MQRFSRFIRKNSLSITLFIIFVFTLIGQSVAGFAMYNHDQMQRAQPTIDFLAYLGSGSFLEALFENWESEFLQMGAYVWLTAILLQKGSPESRSPEGEPELDADPRTVKNKEHAIWPVRKGGIILFLYQYSLTIALLAIFVFSFVMHAIYGSQEYCNDQMYFGQPCVSVLGYLAVPQFWFESFQNWQSEFFSMAVLVILSIFLRHRGSPESKPVISPHDKN